MKLPKILCKIEDDYEHDIGLWLESMYACTELIFVVAPRGNKKFDLTNASTFDLYKIARHETRCTSLDSTEMKRELLVAHIIGEAPSFSRIRVTFSPLHPVAVPPVVCPSPLHDRLVCLLVRCRSCA